MSRHLLRLLQRLAIEEVDGDLRRSEGVIAYPRLDAGGSGPPLPHLP